MKFEIIDDDGFISIVNTDKYQGVVDEDWELESLLKKFVDQMNYQNIIVWATDESGGTWNIEIRDNPSDKKEFRQFEFPINVTSNALYLCPYSDLTMVAQFKDETLPQRHNSDMKIGIKNGAYLAKVRQMFDPAILDFDDDAYTHFEIIFIKTDQNGYQRTKGIFWCD